MAEVHSFYTKGSPRDLVRLAGLEWVQGLGFRVEGQGDLVSRLRMGIIRVTTWVIGVIDLLTKSP